MRLFAVTLLAAIAYSSTSSAQSPFPEIPVPTPQPYARTSAVNSNGSRHDDTNTRCVSTSSPRVWNQSSVRYVSKDAREADQADCSFYFENFVEVVPGISFPRKACFKAFVVSVGGISNIGKRGELWCNFEGKQYDVGPYRQTRRGKVRK